MLFDLGGVLVDWNPRHLYRQIFAEERAMEEFLATICTQAWNEEQDCGRPFAEGVRLLVERHPHLSAEIRAYDARWHEMLKGPIEDSVALLGELRTRGVALFALTNWSAEKFALGRDRFLFFEWFAGIVVSGEERVKKPDARIFELAIRRFGLAPVATLFVDDSAVNVAAAAGLGLRTHHFTGAARLRTALVENGLLPA
ncbi:MAG: HAD family phosphatase [Stellaceae bacterium]